MRWNMLKNLAMYPNPFPFYAFYPIATTKNRTYNRAVGELENQQINDSVAFGLNPVL